MTKTKDKRLFILTSNVCNNNCIFCLEDKRIMERPQFSLEELKKNISKVKESKIKDILFTANEPTINKSLIEAVRYASSLGFRKVCLITNGRRLSYTPYLKSLIKAGINQFNISIHSSNARIHDSLTRTPGSFLQTHKALVNLSGLKNKFNFELNTNTTLTKANLGSLDAIIGFALKFRPDNIILNPVIPHGRANKNFDLVVPKFTDIANAIASALKDFPSTPIRAINLPPCMVPENPEVVGAKEIIIIPAPKKHIRIKSDAKKTKGHLCKSCARFDSCEGIWEEYTKRFGFSEFKPIKKAMQ